MKSLQEKIKAFVDARNWDSFHNPKNLVLSLCSEIGELAEIFRWLTPEESAAARKNPLLSEEIEWEMADIFTNLLLLAKKLDIDLITATEKKLQINAEKYPVDRCKGKAGMLWKMEQKKRLRTQISTLSSSAKR